MYISLAAFKLDFDLGSLFSKQEKNDSESKYYDYTFIYILIEDLRVGWMDSQLNLNMTYCFQNVWFSVSRKTKGRRNFKIWTAVN